MTQAARAAPPAPKLSLVVCIFCILATAALLYAPLRAEFLKIEPWTADWRTAVLSDKTTRPHTKVAIVVINKDTLAGYAYHSPTPRNLLAAVIRAVDSAEPAAIGVDIYFVRPTEPDNDHALVRAVQAHGKVVLAAVNESATQFSESERQFQSRFLSEAGARVGFLNLRRDQDEVVRYTSPPVTGSKYPDSFALQVARTTLGPNVRTKGPATFEQNRLAFAGGLHDRCLCCRSRARPAAQCRRSEGCSSPRSAKGQGRPHRQ
ncbi:MAG: CHASE2 domain-containing protein [Rhodospirillales bacterium]|nr:CHASE2 domain-containing protein [Rhodospirillales bacterium]